jgi:hypothetical protein
MDIEEAIRIADLWRAGKLIGGDEDAVRDALLGEVERLQAENAELRQAKQNVCGLLDKAGELNEQLRRELEEARRDAERVQSVIDTMREASVASGSAEKRMWMKCAVDAFDAARQQQGE